MFGHGFDSRLVHSEKTAVFDAKRIRTAVFLAQMEKEDMTDFTVLGSFRQRALFFIILPVPLLFYFQLVLGLKNRCLRWLVWITAGNVGFCYRIGGDESGVPVGVKDAHCLCVRFA